MYEEVLNVFSSNGIKGEAENEGPASSQNHELGLRQAVISSILVGIFFMLVLTLVVVVIS